MPKELTLPLDSPDSDILLAIGPKSVVLQNIEKIVFLNNIYLYILTITY